MLTDSAQSSPISSPASRPKMADVAARISAHLKRIEHDKALNTLANGRNRFWFAGARPAGNRVFCCYISYQGTSGLTRDEAERYLAKLDAGFVGRHFEALRDDPAPTPKEP